jgi:hypothetical protein
LFHKAGWGAECVSPPHVAHQTDRQTDRQTDMVQTDRQVGRREELTTRLSANPQDPKEPGVRRHGRLTRARRRGGEASRETEEERETDTMHKCISA